MQPRAVSFEEQATIIREKLADLLVEDDEFTAAAQILAGIDLESGMRKVGELELYTMETLFQAHYHTLSI